MPAQSPLQAALASLRRSAAIDAWLLPLLIALSFFVPEALSAGLRCVAALCLLLAGADAVAEIDAVQRRRRYAETES